MPYSRGHLLRAAVGFAGCSLPSGRVFDALRSHHILNALSSAFALEIVPLIECAPSTQQILESGVGASSAENLPDFVEVVGQELAGEVHHERLA
jgi:hypothetical protein